MASITYTALREIEADGYVKAGTDISAAGSDDSFNSVSTSLLGLADNEWVLVAGFANAANNGWFQANGASVLHKVTQDTTTSLVTEAVGPSVTLTGYKRGYNQAYAFDFGISMGTKQMRTKKKEHQPIGPSAPEVIYWRTEKFVRVQTGLIQEAALPVWEEFLASVQGGETFLFDRYGTVASPIEQKTCILSSPDISEERDGPLYPGRYRVSFDVRLLT